MGVDVHRDLVFLRSYRPISRAVRRRDAITVAGELPRNRFAFPKCGTGELECHMATKITEI